MKKLPLMLALCLAWPAFGADLATAVQAATASDPLLASAAANRDAALEYETIAKARLLPQVGFQGTAQRLNQQTTQNGKTTDFKGTTSNGELAYNFAFNLRQALYRPRDWAGLSIGKLQAEYGEIKLDAAHADLLFRVTGAWIDVLVAQEQRVAQVDAVKAIELTAAQERRRLAMGDGTKDAVAEADAQLTQARSQLTEADMNLKARQNAFKLLTGLGEAGFAELHLPVVAGLNPFLGNEASALQRIAEVNPELLAARVNERIAQQRLEQASADHRPTLDMVASANSSQNDSGYNLGSSYKNTLIGLQLTVPIYAGGGLDAAQRQAAATSVAAAADTQAALQRLSNQFDTDWKGQEALVERLRAADEMVEAARERRRAAERGIKGGVRTWADVGDAELTLSRRLNDRASLLGTIIKTQSRVLSLLPVSEPAWQRWMTSLNEAAHQPGVAKAVAGTGAPVSVSSSTRN